jgi:hypothetical protein
MFLKKVMNPFGIFLLFLPVVGYSPNLHPETKYTSDLSNSALSMEDFCEWNGIELKGRVQYVNSFADIKIQLVVAFPDLKVKFVESFPDECGEWQVVESFPDFKVQIVESFPDIKVQYVDAFPGLP